MAQIRKEFKKYIQSLDDEALKEELMALYTKIDDVKKHYAMELGSDADRQKLYKKAKKQISSMFHIGQKPRKRPRIKKVKEILREIRTHAIFKHELADIFLHASEEAVRFILYKPNTTDAVYNLAKSGYENAIQLIEEYNLEVTMGDRLEALENNMSLNHDLQNIIKPAGRRKNKYL